MVDSVPKEQSQSLEDSENKLDQSEIDLVKMASRAFAVTYINEIFFTIKSIDPSLLDKLRIIRKYPFYLYLFIQQEEPGKIERLEIYCEHKSNGDGLSEVKKIYHSSEYERSFTDEMKKSLAKNCINWRWSKLEIAKMCMMALSEGKRVGKSIYDHSSYSSEDSSTSSVLHHHIISLHPRKPSDLDIHPTS